MTTLTGDGSPGRRNPQGTAPGSTCHGSPARRRTCRPQGGSGRGSTGSSARSARRTCAHGTGSGRSVARMATCCRRIDCCSCGPTSLRGTGTRPSVDRSATWRCSSTRWRTARPTSQARSDTRRSAGGTSRAGTGTHAHSVLPSASRDTYTGLSRPRTARVGGRHTIPCSRGPRTGAGTLQGRAEREEPGSILNLPLRTRPHAGSSSRIRHRPTLWPRLPHSHAPPPRSGPPSLYRIPSHYPAPTGICAHWCRRWHRSSHGGSGTPPAARTPRSPSTWSCLRTPLQMRGARVAVRPTPNHCPDPQDGPLTDPTLVPLLPPAGAAHGLLGAAGRKRAPEPKSHPRLGLPSNLHSALGKWLLRPCVRCAR